MDPAGVPLSDEDHDYFDKLEAHHGLARSTAGPARLVRGTRDTDFVGREEKMWQEYPSTPTRPSSSPPPAPTTSRTWPSCAGAAASCRCRCSTCRSTPSGTLATPTAARIWLMQRSRAGDRFVGYHERPRRRPAPLRELAADWGRSTSSVRQALPAARRRPPQAVRLQQDDRGNAQRAGREAHHDRAADHRPADRHPGDAPRAARRRLRRGPLQAGHDARSTATRRTWNKTHGKFIDTPEQDNGCTEGADALRQYAQAREAGLIPDATTYDPLAAAP
jgi:hypothetical protein